MEAEEEDKISFVPLIVAALICLIVVIVGVQYS